MRLSLLLMALTLISFSSLSASQESLVDAAMERTNHQVRYDGAYVKLDYPMGDVPSNTGVCTDVIIRSYRQLGIDLQQLVHEDMKQHFSDYPSKRMWGLTRPDKNIDHRRVPNLQKFFTRHGQSLPVSKKAMDYKAGDLVTWMVNGSLPHIGIVVKQRSKDDKRSLIVHNIGRGPQLQDMLFSYPITGHYRY
jgi:uncharacterized protein YijF (DUF1287 family)